MKMEKSKTETERELAVRVLSNADESLAVSLAEWAKGLLIIKHSNASIVKKGRQAMSLTVKSNVIIPMLKIIAKEIKIDQFDASKLKFGSKESIQNSIKSFWKNRSFPTKIGVGASAVALMLFGTQGAGIAALGTAIGVPLWVVFGAGATFAAVLYEEASGRKFDDKLIVVKQKSLLRRLLQKKLNLLKTKIYTKN